MANLNLLKDVLNKDVILRILSEKIEESTALQKGAIEDDPNALRFFCIISDFKMSHFISIFQVFPSVSDMQYINVKNLFRTTVAIRCRELG